MKKFISYDYIVWCMAPKHNNGTTVQSVDTAFAIVEKVEELDRAGISEIAGELSIAKSTAHRQLQTLESNDYLVRENGKYRLSLKHLRLGRHALEKIEIARASEEVIQHLAEETGEAVWVAVEENGYAVYVNKALGDRAVPTWGSIGKRIHLNTASIGKALLAGLSDERIEEIVDCHGLPNKTEKTITQRDELMNAVEEIRDRGVAFNDGESELGFRAVAAPVKYEDELMGAIAIAGTENRMKGDYFREEIPERIMGAAREIKLKLTYG